MATIMKLIKCTARWQDGNVPSILRARPTSIPAHIANATFLNSYTKQEKYRDVIELLHSGAVSLLKAKQSGSGSDLAMYMIETYKLANTPVTEESLGRCSSFAARSDNMWMF
jgi:Golgi to ER traffic protein 4